MNTPFELLRKHSLFLGLSEKNFNVLIQHSKVAIFKTDDFIESPNEKGKYIYFLVKGSVKGGIFSKTGHELNSVPYKDNAVFGLISLINEHPSIFFYQAVENSTVISISSTTVELIMKSDADFACKIFQLIGKLFIYSIDKRIDKIFLSNKAQIIKFLLFLVKKEGKKIGKEILVKHNMTNQDIANFIGCSRQSVSQTLNVLKKKSIIYSTTRNSFLISNAHELEKTISS